MIRKRLTSKGVPRYQVTYPGAMPRTFDRRKDAVTYELEVRRLAALGELERVTPETFGTALTRLLSALERECRPKTVENLRAAERDLKPLWNIPFPRLKRAHVEDLRDAIAARPAPRQAQKALALAKRTCRAAGERGQRIDPGILTLKPPRYESRTPRFLTKEELYELSSWMPEKIRRIVLVAGLTGLRQGELFDLTEDNVDLEARVLHVPRGKTNAATRNVNLSEEVVKALREQLLVRAPGTRLVFPTPRGLRWESSRFMERYFRPARTHAGLGDLTFHDLRRTFVTLMIRAGVDIRTIAQQIGHSDGGGLLLAKYGFLYEDAGKRAAAALDQYLSEVG